MTSRQSRQYATLEQAHIDAQAAVPCVLVAEDDTRMRELLADTLRRDGHEVIEARDGAELLDYIGELHLSPRGDPPIDLIITDVRMPTLSGIDVLAELRWADWAIPVIVITAFGDADLHAEAKRLGAAAVFDKPFDLDDIRTAVFRYAGTAGRLAR